MIVSKANLPKRLKWLARKESLETSGLVSVITQGAVNLSKTMVGAVKRCKWNKFGWSWAEMRSMKFIIFLGEHVFTLLRGAFEPVENDPRAGTREFEFPDPGMFSARLDRAPGKDVVTWFKEFGIWAERVK
jgi:hypothetical protein